MKVRLLLLFIVPLLVSTSTIGIFAIEGSHEGSDFDSLFNSFWWTIVTFTTVGYGDLSPGTTEGRLFGVLVLFAGVVIHSVIISLISNWYFKFQSASERGLKPVSLRNHTIICSDRPDFIEAMIEENSDDLRSGQIVVVSTGSESPLAGSAYRQVPWVRGDGHEVAVLRRAGVKRAKRAYVSYQDDGITVMTVIHVRGEAHSRARVVALTAEHDHAQHLVDIGCDFVLDPHDIYVPMMVKASLSPAVPAWSREIILGDPRTPAIENIPLPDGLLSQTYGTALSRLQAQRGSLTLGIVRPSGRVTVNPPAEHILSRGDRLLLLRPPAVTDPSSGPGLKIPTGPKPGGRILVLSDKPDFISRILQELDRASVDREVTILSSVEPFMHLSDRLTHRWIHESSHSSEGLAHAEAETASIAFIDHERDTSTLMATLRLEQLSEGRCFAIACYREPEFDVRLRNVGCQFALNANELIAPILTQSGRHYGMGYLVQEIISQLPDSEGLFVAELNDRWSSTEWRNAVIRLKVDYGCLPVALVADGGQRLITFPNPDDLVRPGDSLILLRRSSLGTSSPIFAEQDTDFSRDKTFEARLAADPQAVVDELHARADGDDRAAQVRLARLFEKGHGVDRDPEKAFHWYERAAKQGHSHALFKLGTFHYQGFGTKEDAAKAMACLQKSANLGNIRARRTLAELKQLRRTIDRRKLFDHDLFDHLDAEHRTLYLKAVVRLARAGRKLGSYEKGYLKQAAHATRDDQLVHEIEQAVLFDEELTLEPVAGLTLLEQRLIVSELARIATTNGEPSEIEQQILAEVGDLIAADQDLIEAEVTRVQQLMADA